MHTSSSKSGFKNSVQTRAEWASIGAQRVSDRDPCHIFLVGFKEVKEGIARTLTSASYPYTFTRSITVKSMACEKIRTPKNLVVLIHVNTFPLLTTSFHITFQHFLIFCLNHRIDHLDWSAVTSLESNIFCSVWILKYFGKDLSIKDDR